MAAGHDKSRTMFNIIGVIVAVIAVAVIWLTITSSSCSRQISRWQAEYGRGINREVTLYSATGEEIGRWEGIIDMEYVDERVDLMFFDENGSVVDRVTINPGSGSLVIYQV